MEKEAYTAFLRGDVNFIKETYHELTKEDKTSLWVYRLAHDLMSRNPEGNPLSKFTHSSYMHWKSFEPDIDEYIEYVIDEYFMGWNFCYDGARERTVKEEIYRRMNEY